MSGNVPLIVDLDKTLTKVDTLVESGVIFAKGGLKNFLKMPTLILSGKSRLKSRIADYCIPDASLLPYNDDVIRLIEERSSNGDEVFLVTAADQRIADSVTSQFDNIVRGVGSSEDVNLKGEVKASYLVEKFGEGRFDYVGDSKSDIPVWKMARYGFCVNSRMARIMPDNCSLLSSGSGPKIMSVLPRMLRMKQWVKNLLVFLPILLHESFPRNNEILDGFFAMIGFCFFASSVYILNDTMDLEMDRKHPRKSKRPIASGEVSIISSLVLMAALLGSSSIMMLLLGKGEVLLLLISYFMLNIIYSTFLKTIVVIDVMILSIFYTMRIIAGSTSSEINLSIWLFVFSIFIFTSLGFLKRHSSLVLKGKEGESLLLGRGYSPDDLAVVSSMGAASGMLSALVVSLYIDSEAASANFQSQEFLWGIPIVIIYWMSRFWILSGRGAIPDDPVSYAATDRTTWMVSLFCLILIFLARGVEI